MKVEIEVKEIEINGIEKTIYLDLPKGWVTGASNPGGCYIKRIYGNKEVNIR